MKLFFISLIVFCSVLLAGCQSHIARLTAPEKTAVKTNSAEKTQALKLFWKIFHNGDYHHINQALVPLKALYLKNPNDPDLPLLIAHLHFWRVAERFRLGHQQTPNITDDITVAINYFNEAKKLNPDDARITGWLAGAKLAQANIHKDEKDKRDAYYQGLAAIKAYPAFNYFSIGYLFSSLPHTDKHFSSAIDGYFKSMALAYHTSIDRQNPTIQDYLALENQEKNLRLKRAVWNSPIAPHNVEGFYLNFGDFLVKQGKLKQAVIIYQNAKRVSSYEKWPYKPLLEDRLRHLERNQTAFKQTSNPQQHTKDTIIYQRMIFNSYNCMVCHQAQ